jgi:hypothetical protein
LLIDLKSIQLQGSDDHLTVTIFLHLNFSGRVVVDYAYANPNEVALLHTNFWASIYESSQIQFLCVNFKRAPVVGCGKPMPLEESFPLQNLHGEAPLWMKLSQVGCHKKALVIMWGYT